MALINCSECSTQISDKASACPKCGAPVSPESVAVNSNLVTTQDTSKTLKIQTLLACIIIILGIFSLSASREAGLLVIVLGLGWLIVTRARTWWHHG